MSCIFCRHTGPQPPAHTWKRKIFHTRQHPSFCVLFFLLRAQNSATMSFTLLFRLAFNEIHFIAKCRPRKCRIQRRQCWRDLTNIFNVQCECPPTDVRASVALSAFGVGFNFQTKEMWDVSIGWQACLVMSLWEFRVGWFDFCIFSQSFSHTIQSQGTMETKTQFVLNRFFRFPFAD